jgi:sugar O-acyltransferase (sialic acid O-acetyltransferase NeuD family)
MMTPTQIAVYGAGGFAREVAWLAESCNDSVARYEVVCFIDDNEANCGMMLNDIRVVSLAEAAARFPGAKVVSGVGLPHVRQNVVAKAARAGFAFATLVHPRVERSRWVEIGEGSVICAGNILTTNITLGRHVQINLDCTVGHDVVMGDYTTLAPGVHISGWVHFGTHVYVGTGAVIINGTHDAPLVIGSDAVIGAGSVVTKPVPAGVMVVGVPAKPLQKE